MKLLKNHKATHQPAAKIPLLADKLQGYWDQKIWALQDCPSLAAPMPHRRIASLDFTPLPDDLGIELRYALMVKFETKKWTASSTVLGTEMRRIIRFLSEKMPTGGSLLDRSGEAWDLLLRNWLIEKGEFIEKKRIFIDKNQVKRELSNGNSCLSYFRGVYEEVERGYDTRSEWEHDVWDLRRLGIAVPKSKSNHRLSFQSFKQEWLKKAAKQYMRMVITTLSTSSCWSLLNSVKNFDIFTDDRHPDLLPEQVDRPLVLEYSSYLLEHGRSASARRDLLLDLRTFLERAAREEWLPVPRHYLIYKEDLPPLPRHQPRFIPEHVMAQVDAHLPELELFWRQMFIVLTECGMRIGELCEINLDCLSQDADGYYFLKYFQEKLKKDHTVPISPETAAVIIERREAVKADGREKIYLFSFYPGKPIKQDSFSKKINEFFVEHDIRDEAGNLWRFQPHQMRHTVGTRMINNKVEQIFVQKYLGHETPVMTSVYAHIHDSTLREQFEKYKERFGKKINAYGDLLPEDHQSSADSVDLQWFKRNVLAQALPNGYCGLPLQQGACPHANSCLTCASFKTDKTFLPQHRAQLQETKRLVQIAREHKWDRQVEMNERVEKSLVKIITTLEEEEPSHDRQAGEDAEKAA